VEIWCRSTILLLKCQVTRYFTTTQITFNGIEDAGPSIDGDWIVWRARIDDSYEIVLQQISTGITNQITNNSAFDSDVHINDGNVVWRGDQDGDSDIYLYKIDTNTTTKISNNSTEDITPKVDGDYITWIGTEDGGDYDVYLYKISTGITTQVTLNNDNERGIQISGDYITWRSGESEDAEIYIYQISSSVTTQITHNAIYEYGPQIFNNNVVWQGDSEIYLYQVDTASITQITQNTVWDSTPRVNEDYIVWSSGVGQYERGEIFLYEINSQTTRQISHTTSISDFSPKIDGDFIVWHSDDPHDADIFAYQISTNTLTPFANNGVADNYPTINGNLMGWTYNKYELSEIILTTIHTTPQAGTYEESDASLTFSGIWDTENAVEASGGAYKTTSQSGASTSFTFTGRQVTLLYNQDTTFGNIEIAIDNGTPVLIDQFGASLTYQNRWESQLLPDDAHTITLEHPGGGQTINIDALIVSNPDLTPPAAVTLSTHQGSASGEAHLTWKALGDDNMSSTASEYVLRYAATPIHSESEWDAADAISGLPAPQGPGAAEIVNLSGMPPQEPYYFALRTLDDAGNLSALSNSPEVTGHSVGLSTGVPIQLTEDALTTSDFYQTDGDHIVWLSTLDGDYDVYLYQISTGFVKNISNNTVMDRDPYIKGDYVVWRSEDNTNYELYLHRISTGNTTQITDYHSFENKTPPRIDGDYLVWAWGEQGDDIWLQKLSTGAKTRLSQYRDSLAPEISGDYVVWHGNNSYYSGIGVPLYQISTQTTSYLTNSQGGYYPQIDGNYVVWYCIKDGTKEIYLNEISTNTTTQITNNSTDDLAPRISGDFVVWYKEQDTHADIYLYQISTGTTTQIANNDIVDEIPDIYGNYVVWTSYETASKEIKIYEISSGTTTKITQNAFTDQAPVIGQNHIVWHGKPTDTTSEVFLYTIPAVPHSSTYQDTDTALTFSENWSIINAPEASGGSYKTSSQSGASVSFTFTGVQISLIYTANADQGNIEIKIDNGAPLLLDQYNVDSNYQNRWDSPPLSDGLHTITLSHPGGAHNINIDALVISYAPDTTPPAAINLSANAGYSSGEINLNWIAPGDDGSIGTATEYIVRYSNNAIDSQTAWDAATDISGEPIPLVYGSHQKMVVSNLIPRQTYYFAIRALDEIGNLSALSNSPSAADPSKLPESANPLQLTDSTVDESGYKISGDYAVWWSPSDGDDDVYLYQISTGTVKQISDNTAADGNPQINGDYVVWESNVDGDWEIYFYQISTDTTTQVSNNTADDTAAQIGGDHIVWYGQADGDREIYLYRISTGTTTQISHNTAEDYFPHVDGNFVVYYGLEDGDREIYLYQINNGTTTQITNNTEGDDIHPRIDGDYVVWFGGTEEDAEIYQYQISTGTTSQITQNTQHDYYPIIKGDFVVWFGLADGDSEIYLHQISTGTTTQLSYNDGIDDAPEIDGDYVVWEGNADGDWEVYQYQISTGTLSQITNNDFLDEFPFINGDHIVWGSKESGGTNVFLYTIPTPQPTGIYQDTGTAISYTGNWTSWSHSTPQAALYIIPLIQGLQPH
jgi:beta propeller repeat protein